jgi:hypothetical protein
MNPTIEHIREEIRHLPPAERLSLWRELGAEFDPSSQEAESVENIEAAWDEIIASRITDIENGTVELLSGDAVAQRTDALFAELGLTRRVRPA